MSFHAVPPGVTMPKGVRAPGALVIGRSATIHGGIDARGPVHVAPGAHVDGEIRAVGDVIIGARAFVGGGIRAEGRVVLQEGCRVAGEVDAADDCVARPGARAWKLRVGGDLHLHGVAAPTQDAQVKGRTLNQ